MLDRMKSLKNSMNSIQAEMEKTNSMITALALKTGLTEFEEEDD